MGEGIEGEPAQASRAWECDTLWIALLKWWGQEFYAGQGWPGPRGIQWSSSQQKGKILCQKGWGFQIEKMALVSSSSQSLHDVDLGSCVNVKQISIVITQLSRVFNRDLHPFYNGLDRESEQQSVKYRDNRVIEAQQHRKSGNSCKQKWDWGNFLYFKSSTFNAKHLINFMGTGNLRWRSKMQLDTIIALYLCNDSFKIFTQNVSMFKERKEKKWQETSK